MRRENAQTRRPRKLKRRRRRHANRREQTRRPRTWYGRRTGEDREEGGEEGGEKRAGGAWGASASREGGREGGREGRTVGDGHLGGRGRGGRGGGDGPSRGRGVAAIAGRQSAPSVSLSGRHRAPTPVVDVWPRQDCLFYSCIDTKIIVRSAPNVVKLCMESISNL